MNRWLSGGSDEGEATAQVDVLFEPLAVLSFEAGPVLPFLNVLAPPLLFETVESPLKCFALVVEPAVPAERVSLQEEQLLGDREMLVRHAVEHGCGESAALVDVASDLGQSLSQDMEAGLEDRGDEISRFSTVPLAGERPLAIFMQRAWSGRVDGRVGVPGGDRAARRASVGG